METNQIRNRSLISVVAHPLSASNILAVYITLKPLYLFQSGLPQISDMLLIVYAAFIVVFQLGGKLEFPYETWKTVKSLFGLIIYQAMVNIVWTMILGENLMSVILFYVFNSIAFSLCLLLTNFVSLEELKCGIINGCVLSCALSLYGLYAGPYAARGTSFFNNPNQLGYHGLLLISLLFLCRNQSIAWKTLFVVVGSLWLVIASASKAALFGAFGLMIVYLVLGKPTRDIKNKIIQALTLSLVFAAVYVILYSNINSITSNRQIAFVRYRLLNMQAEDDSNLASGRGYERVKEMGSNTLWGMGEGSYYRFETMRGAEAHSTYASILVSYGIIGFIWFLSVFWSIIRSKRIRDTIANLAIMSGLLLYGLSHNGIRNTLLWIFLGMLMLTNATRDEEQQKLGVI